MQLHVYIYLYIHTQHTINESIILHYFINSDRYFIFFGGESLTNSFWKCEDTISPSLTYITVILHYLGPKFPHVCYFYFI